MKYIKLESGAAYTLSELFSKDRKIIIPDLQRDYCWGSETANKNLVKDFVRNILEKGYKSNKTTLNLGLIYGYEIPEKHIQLCDGQQRMTTLFLLMGMLNKKAKNSFQHYLISDTEIEDDKEPYLQYAIRESSLYFLSDLVCKFFIESNTLSVSDISKQSWFFNDYDLDPSIQSMLSALKTIEQEITNIDAANFGKYLTTKLSFIYYDVKNRKNGEETFVVINTTGEPLTTTENLKPLLISAQPTEKQEECSRLWEEWETWFWKYRQEGSNKKNDTANNGLKEFFRWIMLLTTKKGTIFKTIQEKREFQFDTKISFADINSYFHIVKYLFESENSLFHDSIDWLAPDKDGNKQIYWFKLLPVIEYLKRFGQDIAQRKIVRVKTFFEHLTWIRIPNTEESRIGNNIGELLPEAIKAIKKLPNDDIASMRKLENVSKQILTDEEKLKFDLYLNLEYNREELENLFWEAEKHNIWKGEICSLIHWSTEKNGSFNVEHFKKYNEIFCKLFYDKCKYDDLDITRRALLTIKLKEYPKVFRGNTNYSFCWEFSDWQTLIKENEQKFGAFLHKLIKKGLAYQQQIIDDYSGGEDKGFDEFVKKPELLEYCDQKNIRWKDNGWVLIKQERATKYIVLKTFLLYLDLKKQLQMPNWKVRYGDEKDVSCGGIENRDKDIVIVVFYSKDDNKGRYKLQVFRRNNDTKKIRRIASQFQLKWNGNSECYASGLLNKRDTINLVKQLIARFTP
jgi:hypothetical protein